MVNCKHCVLIYLISWPLKKTESRQNYWPLADNISLELAELALYITEKHLKHLTSTLVVLEKTYISEKTNTNINLLEYFLQNTKENISIQLEIHHEESQPWEYFLFFVDSLQAFISIYNSFPASVYERHFYFVIMLTKHTQNLATIIKKIFILCYKFNVIDVILINDHPQEGICLFTYILYSKKSCRKVQPILYQTLRRNFKKLKTVFPEKLNNFYGCPLKISARKVGPYLDFLGNKSNPQPIGLWENLSGVEGWLIRELASTLNFTLKLLPFSTNRSYIKNLTCYGSFLELHKKKADIVIGGFSGSEPNRWLFTLSSIYHASAFIYIVRGKELNPFDRLTKPFSKYVWLVLASSFSLGLFVIIAARFLKLTARQYIFGDIEAPTTFTYIALILGYPVNETPSHGRNFARYIMLILLLLTLVIRSAYQGSLYDAIRRDRFVKIPSGYDDIVKWNYKILISPEIENLEIFPANITITIPVGGFMERIRKLETTEGSYASAIIGESYIDYMKKRNWKPNDLYMSREVIIMYYFVMYFPKNSILLAPVNKKLDGFTSGGILNKLKLNNLTTEAGLRSITKRNIPKKALSNKPLRAMYDIYIYLKIVSILVFLMELMSIRCERLRRIFLWIE